MAVLTDKKRNKLTKELTKLEAIAIKKELTDSDTLLERIAKAKEHVIKCRSEYDLENLRNEMWNLSSDIINQNGLSQLYSKIMSNKMKQKHK